MKWINALLAISAFAMLSCSNAKAPPDPSSTAGGKTVDLEEMNTMSFVAGRTVYVPAYSHIYHRNDMEFDLTATLSIRNTDFNNSIIVKSARYYDTEGNVVREYVESPMELSPMATLDFVVGEQDRTGGSGANFIVEWVSGHQVSEPIVECVMIGTSGQQGVSFLSVGKAIR
jgi:hypothetical protein